MFAIKVLLVFHFHLLSPLRLNTAQGIFSQKIAVILAGSGVWLRIHANIRAAAAAEGAAAALTA